MSRFDYVQYDVVSCDKQDRMKIAVTDLEQKIEKEIKCPRAKALALTKLEEVYMWIGKGIRDDQIVRTGTSQANEQRGDA